MSLSVLVVAEAPRDAAVVRSLVSRVASAARGADVVVQLVGAEAAYDDAPFIRWGSLRDTLRKHRVKPVQGNFGRGCKLPDGGAAANALRLARALLGSGVQANLVVLQRDLDKQPERLEGLEVARQQVPLSAAGVVIGAANPKVEAWAICACELEPGGDAAKRFEVVRRELGGDPRTVSHELDASDETAKKSAKRVLEALMGWGDDAYEPLCKTTALAVLEQRGARNGLRAFIEELRASVAS